MEITKFVVLLDDPLSAVDATVAKHIYDRVIMELLKSHTIIFISHSMQFLSRCDQVIFMKNGSISEIGTYDELTKIGKDLSNMNSFDQSQKMNKINGEGCDYLSNEEKFLRHHKTSNTVSDDDEKSKLEILEEEQDQMNVGWIVLLKYYKVRSLLMNITN